MTFTDQQIKELVELFQSYYPEWENFNHPPFVLEEIEYKQKASRQAQQLLGRSELETLIADQDFDEILSRIEQVGKSTNLLYLSTPTTGDLAILYHPHLQKERLCQEFFELLYDDAASPERLGKFVEFCGRNSLPNYWRFPTFFLFMIYPQTEFFVKNRRAKWFLQLTGQGDLLDTLPSSETYAALRKNAESLKEALETFQPHDMIDIQSFIWVCHHQSETRIGRLTPEAQIELDVPLTTYTYQSTAQYLHEVDEEEEYMADVEVPTFDTLMNPLLQALKSLGGSATIEDLDERTIEFANLTDEQAAILHNPDKSEQTEVAYRLGWTRTYLRKFGLLENPARGVWSLTPVGANIDLVDEEEVKRTIRGEYQTQTTKVIKEIPEQYETLDIYFSVETFELLADLHNNPTNDYYQSKKEAFFKELEQPFKQLMKDVAVQLPIEIEERMETGKRLFSLIPKNDYGQGGAWDFYWGAFYQKGGKRTASAQLSMWINEEVLEFGFYIGHYGKKPRQRFTNNCQKYYLDLLPLLESLLVDSRILFGPRDTWLKSSIDTFSSPLTLQEFLKDPESGDFDVSYVLTRNDVLEYDGSTLRDLILTTYNQVFPLVLLALEDNPMPLIREYLDLTEMAEEIELEAEPELSPAYPLPQLSAETGHTQADLTRWLQAINRKGQAILYGPPGTGKTFLAERLARHLIAESDGFTDLVQFHPAYAYEDFIQGIRPQTDDNGRLTYPIQPGRFLEFCQKAQNRDGLCVLIIDEINRANLARVFGELMYLLEYRDQRIPLAGGKSLKIPKNVRIIGTMNTADRSIALVDHALRRRFAFIHLCPNPNILRHFHTDTGFPIEQLILILEKLNRQIEDPHYEIGHTFFLNENLTAELSDIWQMEIEPYLEEYFFDRPQALDQFRWQTISQELQG